MKRILITISSFLLIFIFCNLLVTGLVGIYISLGGNEYIASTGLGSFVIYTSTMGLSIFFLWLFRKELKLSMSTLVPRIRKLNLPLIVLGMLLIVASSVVIDPLIKMMPESNLEALYDMMQGGMWAITTGVLVAPMVEEYLFRGVLQRSVIKQSNNPYLGIIISALVFGLVHFVAQQMLAAFMSGLILGTIFYLTGSLITVVMIHLLNNGIAYLELMYLGAGTDSISMFLDSKASYTTVYVISCILIVGLGTIGVYKIQKKQYLCLLDRENTRDNITKTDIDRA